MDMIIANNSGVGNQYTRLVKPSGNLVALKAIDKYFIAEDCNWRGIGVIAKSGLGLRKKYRDFDARVKFIVQVPPVKKVKGCLCGEIIKGKANPFQCKLFDNACNPVSPIGPCMVSVEGTCSAYYNYERGAG